MKLKTIYDTEEDIPEGFADLYTERNGKWELTGIEGVKTQADVERVQEALRKEKVDHKATKTKLDVFDGLDPDEVAAQATALEEANAKLEAIGNGNGIDETKIEPIIAARLKAATAPLERKVTSLETQIENGKKTIAEREGEVSGLKLSITMDNIERHVRDAAIAAKVQTSALDDVVLRANRIFERDDAGKILTKDVAGTTPGLTAKEWLKDMEEKAPHWWPASVGGGSGKDGTGPSGGRANNPWSKEAWNLTKQGALVRELGEVKAAELAARVGSKLGATKPAA